MLFMYIGINCRLYLFHVCVILAHHLLPLAFQELLQDIFAVVACALEVGRLDCVRHIKEAVI